ncbi:hypothetical protein Caci_7592 [Catenulispora acidiphila DSM 44928]|uniref:Lipoprotein LpqB N-terminal domain-containing protein n=1 Tax=Catenulispora acidiphila (strain DSM 44928 / JCM 14897 / NBRC 102108 / NRRL B-24433 / ID139908) TaxID=479433 RepID=C7QBC5_CATAD|nr:hypothetical protein [Catenulispora acidiphila]ACU76416.1 hypothetical protein Caci_7592 [Catenulispora acidiphila DSM 44928]
MSARDPERGALRDRVARWAAGLLAVAAVGGAAACAGPPSKGAIHGVTLNKSRNNVVILAREPTNTMAPAALVLAFLQALTGDQKDASFSVAQEYLTPDARAKWDPATSPTKIVQYANPYIDTGQSAGGAQPAFGSSSAPQAAPPSPAAVGDTVTVTAKGPESAQVDQYGFFQYVSPQTAAESFSVKYLGPATGWRIATPPEFRMVLPEAFKRAYQTYQSPLTVYLPTHGGPAQMDQVYLTQDTGKVDYTYGALASAVLHGRYPSQNSNLELQAVTVDPSGLATVSLKALPAGTTDITDVRQALVDTFRDASETQQLLSPTPLIRMRVVYPGCGTACSSQDVAPYTPGAPTVYWVCQQKGQNDTNAAIVSKQLVTGASATSPTVCPANGAKVPSVVGMAGVPVSPDTLIAVKQTPDSADVKTPSGTTMVAVVRNDGAVVVLNDKNADQQVWYTPAKTGKITDLEWDPVDGALWVVDNNSLYRVRDPGGKGPGGAQDQVLAPGLTVSRFKPSPDGLHAVVVGGQPASGGPGSANNAQPAWMATIDRTGDTPSLSTDTVFQLLAGWPQTQDLSSVTLQTATDAAWADARTVVILGTQAETSTPKLFKVYLDGSQDSTIMDPDDAQPAALHIGAVTVPSLGHPSMWTFSDAPGPADSAPTVSYFKRTGGSDSSQEIGSSPVLATVASG